MSNFLTRHWESKAIQELKLLTIQQTQIEHKKLIDTMITLARIGELTPEHYGFFMEALSNQKIGENDVQKHILKLSSAKGESKK